MSNDLIVWIDTETTGLNPDVDEMLEIACIVTDGDLNPVDEGFSVVIKPVTGAIASMSDFVYRMHEANGLLGEIPYGAPLAHAETGVLDYIKYAGVESFTAPLGGSSVGFDRSFIEQHMPDLAKYLHYRTIDVSTVKELVRRWNPEGYASAPAKTGNHRALGDIEDSIAELAHYRKAGLSPA